MDIQDRKKSLTAEELRQRYNLEDISKNKKAIQMQKDEITKLDTHLEDFVEATTETLEELQDQVDGNITTWFYSGVPTLLNEPAVEWTTDTERNRHLGDLYYDQSTGYAYRFAKQTNQYVWIKLTDSDVTEALRIANEAQDTADNKRRVFTTTPTTPYDVGDLWLNNQDLYVCSTARESGSYVSTDFEIATKYTDDSSLNTFVNVTYTAAMQNLTNQIDGKISTWYYSGVPTLSNQPASQWTTDDEKSKHTGDLYYDKTTGYCYMFEYESSTYKWTRIEDSAIIDALAVANAAQDTADNKRRVFVVQPTPPYDIGDIWIKDDEDLYRCKIATVEGGTYSASHWVLATNYTDDTVALAAQQALNDYKVEVQETYATSADLVTTANSINGTVNETYTYITTVEANLNNQISDITTTTQTSTGENSLYIEDATQTNAISYNVDGATEQTTYTGKNKLNYLTSVTGAIAINSTTEQLNGDTNAITSAWISCNPNTSYTISGGNNRKRWQTKDSNGVITYVANDSATITTNSTAKYLRCYYYYSSSTINPTSITNVQIEEGSTATSYEPYVGGIPSPNPDYPQEVKTIPSIINLFDINSPYTTYQVNVNIQNDSITLTNTGAYCRIMYKLENLTVGKTYIFHTDYINENNDSIQLRIMDSTNNTFKVYGDVTTSASGNTYVSFTATETTQWIRIYSNTLSTTSTNTVIFKNPMFEEGSIAHEYVPYGYWSKVKVTGKNMLTIKNITNVGSLVNNGDESITINGGFSSTSWFLSSPITLKANTTYTLSLTNTYANAGSSAFILRTGSTNKVSLLLTNNSISYTSTQDTIIDTIRMYNAGVTYDNYTFSVQLEENSTATTYEPYKENITLVDMSKPNLFDKDNANILNAKYGTTVTTDNNERMLYIPCKPNTTYNLYHLATSPMRNSVGTTQTLPDIGVTIDNGVYSTISPMTITTNANAKYIVWQFYAMNDTTYTLQQMLDSIKIYESNNPTPYYELCKIGDYKDTLSIDDSGNVVINKNIGKVVLNGSESWNKYSGTKRFYLSSFTQAVTPTSDANIPYILSNYYETYSPNDTADTTVNAITLDRNNNLCIRNVAYNDDTVANFKTWLSTHNTDVYYVLATSETITLPNVQIPLYEGINHITFVDDLTTSTSVTYYRITPLSGTYATQKQLNDVSTEKTQEIIQVRNEVQTEITSTQASINVINETITNGVSKVSGTGYTFDSDGLKIEKTDQDVKSLLDNDGLAVSYKNTELLTVRSNGIEAENMTVRKFYVQRPIRMEKTKSISDSTSVGLGFFYVGE